jgi:hypothetical protein
MLALVQDRDSAEHLAAIDPAVHVLDDRRRELLDAQYGSGVVHSNLHLDRLLQGAE